MAYVAPKAIINQFLTNLRAWETEPLASCVFRKGPQYSVKLGSGETCIGIVKLDRLVGGEQPQSGNSWWHEWQIGIVLLCEDDEADPETVEDRRFDLIEEFGQFMSLINQRRLFGGAKVGRIEGCDLFIDEIDDVVYRGADIQVVYRTLRSEANG